MVLNRRKTTCFEVTPESAPKIGEVVREMLMDIIAFKAKPT